ncbi:MAG: hypothetical protein ACOYKZ_05050 [Chlamydiia bacterium]
MAVELSYDDVEGIDMDDGGPRRLAEDKLDAEVGGGDDPPVEADLKLSELEEEDESDEDLRRGSCSWLAGSFTRAAI